LRAGDTALLDQVIVVDGRSTDGTIDIAASAGVDVYQEDALMTEFGPALAKSDAMWRAPGQVSCDIIAFADTDTTGFRCESVGATLASLLIDSTSNSPRRRSADRSPAQAGSARRRRAGHRADRHAVVRPILPAAHRVRPAVGGRVRPVEATCCARRRSSQGTAWRPAC
jgi:glucosyl-3-phosphoglycerate synthase